MTRVRLWAERRREDRGRALMEVEEKRRRGKGGEGVAKDKVVEVEARTGGEVRREM